MHSRSKHPNGVGNGGAEAVEKLVGRSPWREKLHFYGCNLFLNLGVREALEQFFLVLMEKKVYPVFYRYKLALTVAELDRDALIQVKAIRCVEDLTPTEIAELYRHSTFLTLRWMSKILKDGGILWLGVSQGNLAAYCCTRDLNTIPSPPTAAYLFAVEVIGAYRGKQLARPFLKQVFAHLAQSGVGVIISESHVWNRASNKLHQGIGFEIIERIRIKS